MRTRIRTRSWQPYAAATAAACAKELLSVIPAAEVAKTRTVDEATEDCDGESSLHPSTITQFRTY